MSDTTSSVPRPPWRLLLALALVPLFEVVFRGGRLHPDEVYQSLDPAMNRAFGYGVLAWEWEVGLRNWFVPGLFSLLLRLGDVFGVHDVQARRFIVALPQVALHVAMLAAVFRLSARRIGPELARWAVLVIALNPLVIFFGCRAMSESFSAALLVIALERLDADDSRASALTAGLLLGFAQVTRYGSAAFIIPTVVFLGASRRWKTLGFTIAGGVAVALALGVLDKLTWGATLPNARWGGWWHSMLEYLDYNIISGRSASFGTSPWYTYLLRLLAPVGLVGVALWKGSARTRAWLFLVPSVVYLVSVSATPHKEDRFLYPMLVLLCVAGAPAFVELAAEAFGRSPPSRPWRSSGVAKAVVVATALLTLAVAVPALMPLGAVPEWARTGFLPERPELFRLTARASREGTGLVVMNEGLWGAGGSFWFNGSNLQFRGRERSATADHLWCTCDFPEEPCFQVAAQTPLFNRVIVLGPLEQQRLQHTRQLIEGAGFSLADHDGEALYFVRGPRN